MGKKKSAKVALGGDLLQRSPIESVSPALSPQLISDLNYVTGGNNGYQTKAGVYGATARKTRAQLQGVSADAMKNTPLDMHGQGLYASGLYAGAGHGHGLYAGSGHGLYANPHLGSGLHKPKRLYERGSIGRNGNLLHQPQALIPQPYAVNWQWGNTLPPFYQKYHRGY
jgi:hypothetical protein